MPHAITLIRSTSLSSVAQYAYAATAPAQSRLIFLAGACPLNEDGSTAAIGDYAGQAANPTDEYLQENMALCLECYVGEVGGQYGVKLEDQVLVTASGAELLSTFPFDERLLGN